MKSDIEIAKFVYHKIKGTDLERNVTGKLSDRGRPNKSDKEDIVISYLPMKDVAKSKELMLMSMCMSVIYGIRKQRRGKKILYA